MMKRLLLGAALALALASPALATISTPTTTVVDSGNGTTTVFNYSFLIPFQADGATPAVTVQTEDPNGNYVTISAGAGVGQYQISGAGNPSGGTVTYVTANGALPVGWSLIISRSLSYTQPIAVSNFSFYPHTVEITSDNLGAQIQQLATGLGLTIQFPLNDSPGFVLPSKPNRENAVLGFDSSGNPALLTTVPPTPAAATGLVLSVPFPSTSIPSTNLPTTVNVFRTSGYAAAGDGGAADWLKTTGCLATASFTGTITQTVITGTASISGTVLTGSANAFTVGGIVSGTDPTTFVPYFGRIISQTDSTHWNLSNTGTVGSSTITEKTTTLTTSGASGGAITIGEAVFGASLSGGLTITGGSGSSWMLSGNYASGGGGFNGAGPESMTAAFLGKSASADGQCWGLASTNSFVPDMFAPGVAGGDAAPAINNAMAYLKATYNGGALYLLPVIYTDAEPLYFWSNIRLLGAGNRGDSQSNGGLSSTISYTGTDAAIHSHDGTPLFNNEIGFLTIEALAETNEIVNASVWNFLYYHHTTNFGNSSVITKGLFLGSGNQASYDEIENNYFGLCYYCINVAGAGTSDYFYGNRIQPNPSGFGFFIGSTINNFFPNNLTMVANEVETGNTGVTGIAFITGAGMTAESNRFELPSSGTKGVSVAGSGTDTGGTISGANGTLTVGTLTGTVAQGQNVVQSGVTQLCTISTNVSGSGSGSVWNIIGCSAASNVPLTYETNSNLNLFGNYYAVNSAANLTDIAGIVTGLDAALAPLRGVAVLAPVKSGAASISPDRLLAPTQEATVLDNSTVSVLAPLHPFLGAMLSITIRNNSGGNLGTVNWNSIYKMTSFTSPTDQHQATIQFYFSPAGNWVETNEKDAVPIG